MITLNDIRKLILKQDEELKEIIRKYNVNMNEKDHLDVANNKNSELLKAEIEQAISENDIYKANELFGVYKVKYPNDISNYSIEGNILLLENNIEKAIHTFNQGLNIDNQNIDLLYNMGVISYYKGDFESSLYYYNECIKYCNDLNLIDEIEEHIKVINNNLLSYQSNKKYTIITLGLEYKECNLFYGEEDIEIVNIIFKSDIEFENKYTKDNITIIELNPNNLFEMIEYLNRLSSKIMIIFKQKNILDKIEKLKKYGEVCYYINDNEYLKNINYYRNNINLFIEKNICDKVDFIFTNNISVFNYKKIIENRDNVYYLNEDIDSLFTFNNLYINNMNIDIEEKANKLKEYIKTLDNEYEKSKYLLASEHRNIESCLEITEYIYNKYNTKEFYDLFISILSCKKDYSKMIAIMFESDYCDEVFKAELLYMNSIQNYELINFIINISIKNYTLLDDMINNENYKKYKLAMYNFEISNKEESFKIYNELIKEQSPYITSPLFNRNMYHILYLNSDKYYEYYENIYNGFLEELFKV